MQQSDLALLTCLVTRKRASLNWPPWSRQTPIRFIGVVDEVRPGWFTLTPLGQPLRRDATDSVWASVIFWSDLLADSWTYLADCVRAGGPTTAVQVMEQQGIPSRWSREANAQAIFHAAFAESTEQSMTPFVAAYDFSQHRVIVDLGGGNGALLRSILQANLKSSGILVERADAISGAKPKFSVLGLNDRSDLVVADLITDVLPCADAYILQSVLHGYDDERARRILQNCRDTIRSPGKLLVIEVVLPTRIDRAEPHLERMLMADLNMLAVTGGRERNQAEWESLLASAGFRLSRVTSVNGGISSIVEALPLDKAR